jgi:methionine-rich copper-binding protein CopC
MNTAARPWWGRRFTVIATATAAILALTAAIAFAHDPLATQGAYSPAPGAVVSGELPASIVVTFQDTFPKAGDVAHASVPVALVTDAAGTDHVASAGQNPSNAKQLVITTKDRSVPGPYKVTWTITASDGHAVSNNGSDTAEEGGPLRFTVADAGTSAAASTTSTTSTSSSSSSSSGTVIAAVVGVALVILIGAGAILFWVRRRRDEFDQESDS